VDVILDSKEVIESELKTFTNHDLKQMAKKQGFVFIGEEKK